MSEAPTVVAPRAHPIRLRITDDRQRTRLTVFCPGFFLINLKQDDPIDLEIDPPEPQGRLTVAFRIILAVPAMIVMQILRNLSGILAFFSWWIAIFAGRVPEGIRNFGAFALRYETQTYAYLALLTPRYPSFNVGINA